MLECWTRNLLKLEHWLSSIFRAWGRFVAKHPILVIIVAAVFAGTFSFFIAFLEAETETRYLYAAEDTPSWKNTDRYDRTWGKYDPLSRLNTFIITGRKGNSDLYTTHSLNKLLLIDQKIKNVSVQDNGVTIRFEDICSRQYSNNDDCLIQCVLEYFDFNKTIINQTIKNTNIDDISNTNVNKILNYPVAYSPYSQDFETLLTRVGTPVSLRNYNYTYTTDDGNEWFEYNIVNGTPAFQCSYITDGDNYDEDLLFDWEDAWMEELDNVLKDLGIDDQLEITYSAAKSFDDELTRAVASDVNSFIITFVILSTLGSLLVFRFLKREWGPGGCCKYAVDPKRSRALVANFGVLAACLAIGVSFGLTGGILGIKFNSIVSISPFLLLGLGVDDMFVILRSYELTSPALSVQERIELTMERGGVSIMFTSITDLVAFGIGSTSRFGAISAFCSYCAVGVTFDFLFCVTFFLGFMVLDSRWNESVDNDFRWSKCLCCCFYKDKTCGSCKQQSDDSDTKTSSVELGAAKPNDNKKQQNVNDVSASQMNMEGSSIISHLIDDEASSQSMERLGAFILKDRRVSIVIMLLFVGYVAGAAYGISTLVSSEDPVDLAPNDSYLRSFYDDGEKYFDEIGPALMLGFDKTLEYHTTEVQEKIAEFTEKVETQRCFRFPELTQSWLPSYLTYLEENDIEIYNDTHWYYVLFSKFLNDETGSQFIDDIWETARLDTVDHSFDNSLDGLSYFTVYNNITGKNEHEIIVDYDEFAEKIGTSLRRSRIWVQMFAVGYGADILATCLPFIHKVANDYEGSLGAYYYMFELQFAETNEVAVQQTILNVSLASIAAFLMCLILIPFPSVSLYVAYAVGQILLGVMGYMSLWDLSINTTSMINIVISVGFSVDNTAHFCHAYMIAPIKEEHANDKTKARGYLSHPSIANNPSSLERHQRCLFALNSVGVPILAGDISTICALLPLAAAESAIFTSFFKILFLVMLFGAAHAILFLPILFSLIGPVHIKGAEEDEDVDAVDKAKKLKSRSVDAKDTLEKGELTNDV